ncbi:hypothetical protein MY4038_003442 [Beauveria bassiana]
MSTSSTLMLLKAGEPEKRTHLTIRDCKLSLFEYFALYGVVRLDTCSCLDGLVARNPDGRFQEHAGPYGEEYGRRGRGTGRSAGGGGDGAAETKRAEGDGGCLDGRADGYSRPSSRL